MNAWRDYIIKKYSRTPIVVGMSVANVAAVLALSVWVFPDVVYTLAWLMMHYLLVILAEVGLLILIGAPVRTRLGLKYDRGYRDGYREAATRDFINLPRYYKENHIVYIAGFDKAFYDYIAQLMQSRE